VIQDDSFGRDWSASLRRASDPDLRAWLAFALELADQADEIARTYFRREPAMSTKTDGTFVTEADLRIEELLRDRISKRYPTHRITGEEYGVDDASDSVRWYLDPIDATANYVRGIPLFATLIAAEFDGELQIGVISAPALHQRWHAGRGLGAWTVGGPAGPTARPLVVSSVDSVSSAHLLYRSVIDLAASRVAEGFEALRSEVASSRGFGDFWGYALVADGAAEVMVEQDLGPWDLAAPWVVVEEAGGRITDFDGTRSLERGEGCATNGILHRSILQALRREMDT
jgi:histidinol-phosphatase